MAAQPLLLRGLAGAVLVLAALTAGCASSRPRHAVRPQPVDSVQVGYGEQARKDVTTAVGSVRVDSLHDKAVLTLEQLITGRVSGVEVIRAGNGISLRIRGAASFYASSEPLYVIDGVKVQASTFTDAMAGINPADVMRIDVLKDAAATAIYGTEGGNGVVLVTTKRGGH